MCVTVSVCNVSFISFCWACRGRFNLRSYHAPNLVVIALVMQWIWLMPCNSYADISKGCGTADVWHCWRSGIITVVTMISVSASWHHKCRCVPRPASSYLDASALVLFACTRVAAFGSPAPAISTRDFLQESWNQLGKNKERFWRIFYFLYLTPYSIKVSFTA